MKYLNHCRETKIKEKRKKKNLSCEWKLEIVMGRNVNIDVDVTKISVSWTISDIIFFGNGFKLTYPISVDLLLHSMYEVPFVSAPT